MVSKNSLWRRLTSPNDALTVTHERSRARLLASLVLLMLLVGVLINVIYMIAVSTQAADSYLLGTWLTLGLLVVAYVLSRSRYYYAAAIFTVALFSVAVFLAFVSRQSYTNSDLLIILVVPVLLSSTFLSLRAAVLVTVINVCGVFLLSIWHPSFNTPSILESLLTSVLYISLLVILVAYHRGEMEKDQRAEMALAEERYRSELEQRVIKRTAELARVNATLRTEIQDRRLAESALRESEVRYRSLIELLPNAVFLVQGGLIQLANRAAADMVDLPSADDMAGRPINEFLISEGDSDANGRLLSPDVVTVDRLERTILRHDGQRLIVETAATAIRYKGEAAILAVAQDVTQLRQTQHERELLVVQLRMAYGRLQHLSRHAVEVQEAERRHLARELHDEIGQSLTAIKIHLRHGKQVSDLATVAEELESSLAIVDQLLAQVRNLSLDLRPAMLDEIGLVGTLRWYVDRQAQLTGIDSRFIGELVSRLPSQMELTCFRMVQEALTNVVRHANANKVNVILTQNGDDIQLVIEDDGRGFDVEAAQESALQGKSLGLLGMEERVHLTGGAIEISSTIGEGTTIRVSFCRDSSEIVPMMSPSQALQLSNLKQ